MPIMRQLLRQVYYAEVKWQQKENQKLQDI